jgi:hypothetical protein
MKEYREEDCESSKDGRGRALGAEVEKVGTEDKIGGMRKREGRKSWKIKKEVTVNDKWRKENGADTEAQE